jgi:amino acid transporter
MGMMYMPPVIGLIVLILTLVYFSYRQTIAAYPNGGGSYTVARENLGVTLGLTAAAALMIDYVLNVAVAISAGVGALISALPALQSHVLALCLGVLLLLTFVNLRGIRTTGFTFAIPTYVFVAGLLAIVGWGVFNSCAHGGHPVPVEKPPAIPAATTAVGVWLLMRAFASGCTAMTGVEAVSNGTPLFVEPAVPNAQRCLSLIVGSLGLLLVGIAYLSHAYHIGAMDQTKPGYQSVISQLVAAVAGRNALYYILLASVILVLALSANTSFAGFPRICRLLSEDHFLPNAFANLGRRLVYTLGILLLSASAALLLLFCQGITDRLIPLFAVGAFAAFTLSQFGMVSHWLHQREKDCRGSLIVNAVGGVSTAMALIIILVAKFTEGAWITVCIIPLLLVIFRSVEGHYRKIAEQVQFDEDLDLADLSEPIVVVPIRGWNKLTQKALRAAFRVSRNIRAVHISDREDDPDLRKTWTQHVEEPSEKCGFPPPRLEIVTSSYRQLFRPVLDLVAGLRKKNPDRMIAVVVPEVVQPSWYEYLLHSHRAAAFRFFLLLQGDGRTVVISIPWYIGSKVSSEEKSRL